MKNSQNSKETIKWLFFFAVYGVMFAAHYILRMVFHIGYKDIVYDVVIFGIPIIASLGYLVYIWKIDLSKFSKRVILAIPFALLFGTFLIMLTGTFIAAIFALPVYYFLLYRTPNWKQHLSITLILASILAVALKLSVSLITNQHNSREISICGALLFTVSIIFIGFSYGLYIRHLQYENTIELSNIFIRIFKFTLVFTLYFAVFLILAYLRIRHFISFPVSISLIAVLSIIFLAIVYFFDLMPISRERKNKK